VLLISSDLAPDLTPFLAFDLRDPRLHHLPDEGGRQGLVRGELDCPFGNGEALKFALKRFYD